MATTILGPGRNFPDQETADKAFATSISPVISGVSPKKYVKRTAVRPSQLTKRTKAPHLNIERAKMGVCARKYGGLTKAQRKVWKTICVRVERTFHHTTKTWQVKGRLAFMSSCLLGFIRSCDRQDTMPPWPAGIPPDTIINILMFHLKIVDVNEHPVKNATVAITSHSLKEKDGSDKTMYNQTTDQDGYPPDFGMAANFEPYDILVSKVYQSQIKTVSVSNTSNVSILMC
jgi:hypothetical protein